MKRSIGLILTRSIQWLMQSNRRFNPKFQVQAAQKVVDAYQWPNTAADFVRGYEEFEQAPCDQKRLKLAVVGPVSEGLSNYRQNASKSSR